MSRVKKVTFAYLFIAAMVLVVGCRSEVQPDSNGAQTPAMPPPQQPGTPVPGSDDQSALPTEGDPGGVPSTSDAPAQPAEPKQVELPTEGDPVGEPQPPGTATAPAPAEQSKAAKIEASLAALSAEDRALARKQKICPVSGGPLGAMGPPKKISVAGHEVFICCEGCERPLLSNPAKHLAKIGLKPADGAQVQ